MEITEIKQRLTLSMVLNHYGLKADKSHRISCPFHEDKTPSMQLYYKTQTAYCFSANCSTNGHSLDVIELVTRLEKTDKHNGILKCVEMITGYSSENREERIVNNEQSSIHTTNHTCIP